MLKFTLTAVTAQLLCVHGTTTTTTTTTKADYAYAVAACDGVEYCQIYTSTMCEAAAVALGNPDTVVVTQSRNNKVAGCHTSRKGKLRFNTNYWSSTLHGTVGKKKVICAACELVTTPVPTTTTTTTTVNYITDQRSCDGTTYCTIRDENTCGAAAAAVGLTDTTAILEARTNKVAGCYTSVSGSLKFNAQLLSTVKHMTNGQKQVLCQACSAQ